jgi:hypothetical protein
MRDEVRAEVAVGALLLATDSHRGFKHLDLTDSFFGAL